MAVRVEEFDHLDDGRLIEKITLSNACGTEVSLLTLGATIQSFIYEGKDIVLGFDSAADYFASGAYIGATVGRVCNRTADGTFELNGTTYRLFCNEVDRNVHLHGGKSGFDKKVWECAVVEDDDEPTVSFETESADGEEGYPGHVKVRLEYTLTADNTLILDYIADSDADTPLNMTNHVYFNLNGCDGADVKNHQLRIAAQEYTPVNARLIPTGEYAPVAGTCIDFREFKAIGEALNGTDAGMEYTGGVDHNFVLAHGRRDVSEAAVAYSPESCVRVTCCTDLPGLQVYTGNFLDEKGGKYGLKWGKYQGFCLETQFFANSVNEPRFPSVILKKGEPFVSRTTYRIDKVGGES